MIAGHKVGGRIGNTHREIGHTVAVDIADSDRGADGPILGRIG